MSTDISIVANHSLNFTDRPFKEIAEEICNRLNNISFCNNEFLRNFYLEWNEVNSDDEQIESKPWNYIYYDRTLEFFAEDRVIDFSGLYGFLIEVDEHTVHIKDPSYRYSQWMLLKDEKGNPDKLTRNEWRKYFSQILEALGGNELIYMDSNTVQLFLGKRMSYRHIKNELMAIYGAAAQTLEIAYHNGSYFVDDLSDVDWELNYMDSLDNTIIGRLLRKLKRSEIIQSHFGDFFNKLKTCYQEVTENGENLESLKQQIDFLHSFLDDRKDVVWQSHLNKFSFIFSLLETNDESAATVYFNFSDDGFRVVENVIGEEEGLMASVNRHLITINKIKDRYSHVYGSSGLNLNISGQILFTRDEGADSPFRLFLISSKFDEGIAIYDVHLNLLMSDVSGYRIINYNYCLAEKDEAWYLLHFFNGYVTNEPLKDARYFRDIDYLQNDIEYLVLESTTGKFALYMEDKMELFNGFTWTAVRARQDFDYLFYQKDNLWYRLNLHNLSSRKVGKPEFDSK
ncbi:MAG: hypothetical protein ACOCWC_05680 [Bacteroidota bacterium]